MMRILLKWLVGGFLSIGAIWMVTAVFSDSVPLEEWSGALGRNTLAPGTTYQERREGWATNHIGIPRVSECSVACLAGQPPYGHPRRS